MSELRHRFAPEGPRLTTGRAAAGEGAGAAAAGAAAAGAAAAPPARAPAASSSDDAAFARAALAFAAGLAAALLAPSILRGARGAPSTVGRSFSAGGFFTVAAAVAAALFSPGGLPAYLESVAAVACLGFGLMIGGLVGDTVRFF